MAQFPSKKFVASMPKRKSGWSFMQLPIVPLALAVLLIGGVQPFARAQEAPVSSDCLQDNKLEAVRPGTDLVKYVALNFRSKSSYSADEKATIDRVVKYRVYVLSWPEERNQIAKNRLQLLADAHYGGSGNRGRAFRREVVNALVKYVPDLFENHCVVRVNAVEVFTWLNEPAALQSGIARLLPEMAKAEQTEEVKLRSCFAIERMGKMGSGFQDIRLRNQTVSTLTGLLGKRAELRWWTCYQAVSALGAVAARDERKSPVGSAELLPAMGTLLEIVNDSSIHPKCRARAADVLGRLDVSALRIKNFELIAHEFASLAAWIGDNYVKNFEGLNSTEDTLSWQHYMKWVVLGFRGDRKETGLLQLAGQDPEQLKMVQEAEKAVVALTLVMLETSDDLDAIRSRVDELKAWISQNVPPSRKLDPKLDPLPRAAIAEGP